MVETAAKEGRAGSRKGGVEEEEEEDTSHASIDKSEPSKSAYWADRSVSSECPSLLPEDAEDDPRELNDVVEERRPRSLGLSFTSLLNTNEEQGIVSNMTLLPISPQGATGLTSYVSGLSMDEENAEIIVRNADEEASLASPLSHPNFSHPPPSYPPPPPPPPHASLSSLELTSTSLSVPTVDRSPIRAASLEQESDFLPPPPTIFIPPPQSQPVGTQRRASPPALSSPPISPPPSRPLHRLGGASAGMWQERSSEEFGRHGQQEQEGDSKVGEHRSEDEGEGELPEEAKTQEEKGVERPLFQTFPSPVNSKLQVRSTPSVLHVSPVLRNFVEDEAQGTHKVREYRFGASSRGLGRQVAMGASRKAFDDVEEETKDQIAERIQRELGISQHKIQVALDEFQRKRMELAASMHDGGETPVLLLAGEEEDEVGRVKVGREITVRREEEKCGGGAGGGDGVEI
eukprot:522738-Hanusia_phi.AAC.2